MKAGILEVLQCPKCGGRLEIACQEATEGEIRSGGLVCDRSGSHRYEVRQGIIRFESGFDHEAVRRELAYENSTYLGPDQLTDSRIIAQFPESMAQLWPHTRHFGPDFRSLINRLNLTPNSWVLDIGTGPCWSARLMAERSAHVIALDVNDAEFYGLRTADILFDAHEVYFERVLESMTHLPFRNGTMDFITFNAAFHHTPDHEQTLRQCFRVLKPGGTLALLNENFVSFRQRFFPKKNAHTETDLGSHHDISYRDFERAAREIGFNMEYHLADHVLKRLHDYFTFIGGNFAARIMERFPILLQQLYSALILLQKPRASTVSQIRTVGASTTGHFANPLPRRSECPRASW